MPSETRYLLYFGGFWLVLIGGATWFFGGITESQRNPNQAPTTEMVNGAQTIELEANQQGHYVAGGAINGADVTFILDTGATRVTVSDAIAQRAGLERESRGRARTAAGTVTVWSTTIPELRLGDMRFRNVPGTISPSMDADMALLGMTALGQVDFSQENGVLTLRRAGP
ncbi:retropepsin-like aspartic protease family protein [Vreelandella utahensis]|uniref:retropepsin-like aspartic protease family protein n=1 Tax=Vreelandella halophila TaxID=86177 RepID=UPI000984C6AF|nr:TIGR02281 family clan AA aspartic protease [Halomonas utahensis]